jgi:hypothetical protein
VWSAQLRAMKNRRSFLAAVAGGGVSLALLSKAADAQTDAPAMPAPSPSGKVKPPSALSLATAATFRRFDSQLSDEQVTSIARALDENRDAGSALNPKKKRLKNSDEPVTRFAAGR